MKLFDQEGILDADVMDALYELGNVGVGMASVALGKILGMRVSIDPPKVQPAGADISALIPDEPDKVAVGILMSMENTLSGAVLFLVEKEFITQAVAKMTGTLYDDVSLLEEEESLSAVQELANIMAAAYMKAFGSYSGLRIYLAPVMVGVDMIGALVSYPLAQLSMENGRIICIDTSFSLVGEENQPMQNASHILMLPDESSIEKLMQSLGL